MSYAYPNLRSIFWPAENSRLKTTLTIIASALFLALASQITVPLSPVPLTFQSATVVLLGMTLGLRMGLFAVLTYLTMGLMGLPVFAEFSAGIPVFMGPTGGYLLGFIPAVALSGFLAQQGFMKGYVSAFLIALVSAASIFLVGVAQLSLFTGLHTAFLVGFKPFILTELFKLFVISLAAQHVWR